MKKHLISVFLGMILLAGFLQIPAYSFQEWITDICTNPDRYRNLSVTVVGQVIRATSDPEGTTRGFYTFKDESCVKDTDQIVIRTTDLPPAGKMFKVKGVVMTDPADGSVYIKEISRSAPGMPSWMLILLIGAGVLFFILLVILIVLLVKPKSQAKAAPTARPAARPAPTVRPEPGPSPPPVSGPVLTRKVEAPSAPLPPEPEKTRAFLSLRAEIVIEKGPDTGKSHAIHKQVTTIGRAGARKNDIDLTDDTVSKEQASIFYDNTTREFSIRNESTTNPTQVNKKIVTDPIKLENNDIIEVGATILRFKKE